MIEFAPIKKGIVMPITSPAADVPLLRIRTANNCINDAKNLPIPKMLFSEFWHEGELCILFADTNLGKSILAVQIADSISRGKPVPGFKQEAMRQPVLYFDFELSDKQFEKRYSNNYTNHYQFDENFYRIEINPECTEFADFEATLQAEIIKSIQDYNARVLIIDNLTYLKMQATETAKEALPLMKLLKELTTKYGLSILGLAHTPKRILSNPLTYNDLAGSKHFSNFSDSIFALGASSVDKSLRYLKQLKGRATEVYYDAENIIICEITKPDNFLGFELLEYANETAHLKIPDSNYRNELEAAILSLKEAEPFISNYQIAQRLNTNKMKVKRVLERNGVKKFTDDG